MTRHDMQELKDFFSAEIDRTTQKPEVRMLKAIAQSEERAKAYCDQRIDALERHLNFRFDAIDNRITLLQGELQREMREGFEAIGQMIQEINNRVENNVWLV